MSRDLKLAFYRGLRMITLALAKDLGFKSKCPHCGGELAEPDADDRKELDRKQ